jgi:hypothetical protein
MKRMLIPLMAVPLMLLGVTPQAYAENGDYHIPPGTRFIKETKTPEGVIVHLRVEEGLDPSAYANGDQIAAAFRTNKTAIRERNLGRTLARCLKENGLSVPRKKRLRKGPPPVTVQDVYDLRSANGLWKDCSDDPALQSLVVIQGEELEIPVGVTSKPVSERLSCYERFVQCKDRDCLQTVANECGGVVPVGADSAKQLEKERADREQADKVKAKDNEEHNAQVNKLKQQLKAKDAKLAVYEAPKPPLSFWKALWWFFCVPMGVLFGGRAAYRYYRTLEKRLRQKFEKEYDARLKEVQRQHAVALRGLEQAHAEALTMKGLEIAEKSREINELKASAETDAQTLEAITNTSADRYADIQRLTQEKAEMEATAARDAQRHAEETKGLHRVIAEDAARVQQLLRQALTDAEELSESNRQLAERTTEVTMLMEKLGATSGSLWKERDALVAEREMSEGLRRANAQQHAEIQLLEARISTSEGNEREAAVREEALNGEKVRLSDELAKAFRQIEELRTPKVEIRDVSTADERLAQDWLEMIALVEDLEHQLKSRELTFIQLMDDIYRRAFGKPAPGLDFDEKFYPLSDRAAEIMSHLDLCYALRSTEAQSLLRLLKGVAFVTMDGMADAKPFEEVMTALVEMDKLLTPYAPDAQTLADRALHVSLLLETQRQEVLSQRPPAPVNGIGDTQPGLPPLPMLPEMVPPRTGHTKRPTPMGLGKITPSEQNPERTAAFSGMKLGCEFLSKRVGVNIETEEELDVLLQLTWVCQEQTFHCFNEVGGVEHIKISKMGSPDYQKRLRVSEPAV